MKRSLALATTIGLVAMPPALAAEPYDATTMALGGTYVTRSVDAISPYWNPANLSASRGIVYLGGNMGLLMGNNTLGTTDVWDALQPVEIIPVFSDALSGLGLKTAPQPSGKLGDFVRYMGEIKNYEAGIKLAISEGRAPGDPPKAPGLPFNEQFNGFVRGDVGLLGVNVAWGGHPALKKKEVDPETKEEKDIDIPARDNDRGVSFRTYVRAPGLDLFITAPEVIPALDKVTTFERDMALELIDLNNQVQQNALDFSALGQKIDTINAKIDEGLGPLLSDDGKSFTVGMNEGVYLTNAISYQMPLSDLAFTRDWWGERGITLGATLKVHTGLPGAGQAFEDAIGKTFPGTKASVPGRIELVNKINLKQPVSNLQAALRELKSDPQAISKVSTASQDFMSAHSLDFVSHSAGPAGVSLDLGTAVPLGGGFKVGAVLQNAPTIWPGQKTTFKSERGADGQTTYKQAGEPEGENFGYTEPLGLRVGGGWELNAGVIGMGVTAEVGEALDGPVSRPIGLGDPSLHLGLQGSLFNRFFGRLGTQLGGKGSLLGGGVGFDFVFGRLDLGGGIEPTGKALGFGMSLNLGI